MSQKPQLHHLPTYSVYLRCFFLFFIIVFYCNLHHFTLITSYVVQLHFFRTQALFCPVTLFFLKSKKMTEINRILKCFFFYCRNVICSVQAGIVANVPPQKNCKMSSMMATGNTQAQMLHTSNQLCNSRSCWEDMMLNVLKT